MRQNKLDDLIRSALQAEPLRPVPRDLQGKVRARLSVVAMIERERRMLRNGAAISSMLVTFAAAAMLLFWMFKACLAPVFSDLPAAMGWLDYVAFSVQNSVASIVALAVVIASAVFVLLLWSIFPRRYTVD